MKGTMKLTEQRNPCTFIPSTLSLNLRWWNPVLHRYIFWSWSYLASLRHFPWLLCSASVSPTLFTLYQFTVSQIKSAASVTCQKVAAWEGSSYPERDSEKLICEWRAIYCAILLPRCVVVNMKFAIDIFLAQMYITRPSSCCPYWLQSYFFRSYHSVSSLLIHPHNPNTPTHPPPPSTTLTTPRPLQRSLNLSLLSSVKLRLCTDLKEVLAFFFPSLHFTSIWFIFLVFICMNFS